MKCVVTGQETSNKTKNIPLSREGRGKLTDILSDYNNKLKDRFVKEFAEKSGNESPETLEAVEKLAPKLSKRDILGMLTQKSVDELFEAFEEKKEESDDQ
jgi:hypothetical protein